MQRWWFLLILVFCASCQFFLSKEEQTQKLVDEELMAIDWNDVDQYPLFDGCDESVPKTAQRACFQENLMLHFAEAFEGFTYEVDTDLNDTVLVDFKIDKHGFVTVLNIEEKNGVQQVLPFFSEEVSKRLNDLTTVAPAIKRGAPVSITVRLPLVLNTNN